MTILLANFVRGWQRQVSAFPQSFVPIGPEKTARKKTMSALAICAKPHNFFAHEKVLEKSNLKLKLVRFGLNVRIRKLHR